MMLASAGEVLLGYRVENLCYTAVGKEIDVYYLGWKLVWIIGEGNGT